MIAAKKENIELFKKIIALNQKIIAKNGAKFIVETANTKEEEQEKNSNHDVVSTESTDRKRFREKTELQ